eukprot:scaffold942_cov394-Pavlova_lutheri.AAC.5
MDCFNNAIFGLIFRRPRSKDVPRVCGVEDIEPPSKSMRLVYHSQMPWMRQDCFYFRHGLQTIITEFRIATSSLSNNSFVCDGTTEHQSM